MRFCCFLIKFLLLLVMMVHVVVFVSFCTSVIVNKGALWVLVGWHFAGQKINTKWKGHGIHSRRYRNGEAKLKGLKVMETAMAMAVLAKLRCCTLK